MAQEQDRGIKVGDRLPKDHTLTSGARVTCARYAEIGAIAFLNDDPEVEARTKAALRDYHLAVQEDPKRVRAEFINRNLVFDSSLVA